MMQQDYAMTAAFSFQPSAISFQLSAWPFYRREITLLPSHWN
jgi:hypothetical protein